MVLLPINLSRTILNSGIKKTPSKGWENVNSYQCRFLWQKINSRNRSFISQLQTTTKIGSVAPNNILCRSPYLRTTGIKSDVRTVSILCYKLEENSSLLARYASTKPPPASTEPALSRKDKLKRAVKEYGSTVIVFHVGISLVSLGVCYILVSSGIDMEKILVPFGLSGSVVSNAGTFVTAYAIHKVFAPVRISITLTATPFIVRYLRRVGFLKKPAPP